MSVSFNTRWSLVRFAVNHDLSLEDAIELVDCVESWKESIGYAFDEIEKEEYTQEYEFMVISVTSIYNDMVKKHEHLY